MLNSEIPWNKWSMLFQKENNAVTGNGPGVLLLGEPKHFLTLA
jgi:hypothetical protein